jgi:hypothetical protein
MTLIELLIIISVLAVFLLIGGIFLLNCIGLDIIEDNGSVYPIDLTGCVTGPGGSVSWSYAIRDIWSGPLILS